MSYTYSGDPATSLADRVRFLMQDTADPGLITDSELAWVLIEEGSNPYSAAAALCLVVARRYAGKSGSRSIGDVSITYGDLSKTYADLALTLTSRSGRFAVPVPYLGGLSQADKDANDGNGDHVERYFDDGGTWTNGGAVSGSNLDRTDRTI